MKRFENFENTSNTCDSTLQCWCTSGSNRLETVEAHRIEGLVPYSSDSKRFETFENILIKTSSTLWCWSTSDSMKFETFETRQIRVLVPYSAGILVIRRGSKLLKKHQIHISAGLLVIR